MGIGSWIKSKFKKELPQALEVSKIETPEKIIETKIKPVRFPTILDIGERLAIISRDLSDLKQEMVSKSWFKSEYEDAGSLVLERLKIMETKLDSLNILLKELSNRLSNLTEREKAITYERIFDLKEKIIEIIVNSKKVRYKDIINKLNISPPTLSKYLKYLTQTNKIKRTKIGKAVFYEPL
jgi:DNA-binding transcriptional ArsR family regulator